MNIKAAILHLKSVLLSEKGAEVVDYLGISVVTVLLIGAVAAFLAAGSGQVLIDGLRDIISAMINGFQQGW